MLANIPKKFLSEEGPSNSDDDDDDENGNNNKKSDRKDNSDDDDDNDNLFEENDSDDLKSKKLSVNSNKNIHNNKNVEPTKTQDLIELFPVLDVAAEVGRGQGPGELHAFFRAPPEELVSSVNTDGETLL